MKKTKVVSKTNQQILLDRLVNASKIDITDKQNYKALSEISYSLDKKGVTTKEYYLIYSHSLGKFGIRRKDRRFEKGWGN